MREDKRERRRGREVGETLDRHATLYATARHSPCTNMHCAPRANKRDVETNTDRQTVTCFYTMLREKLRREVEL